MIDAEPVTRALRHLSRIDDATLRELTAGSPLTREALRRALVVGELAPTDFEQALRHALRQPDDVTVHAGQEGKDQ